MQSLSAVCLDALDNVHELRVNLVRGLQAANLGEDILGRAVGHDGGELLGLVVVLDILETESHLNSVEQELDVAALLGNLGSRGDEALLAGQLAHGRAANTLNSILEMGVANALDNLVDIGSLLVLVDAVLLDNQVLGLVESTTDLGHDVLVLQGIVNGGLSAVVAVVGSSGVASVDGEELALDKGLKVLNPCDALDIGDAVLLERSLFYDPFEELFQGHVQTGVGVLGRDNAVNGRVGIAGALVVGLKTVGRSI